MSRWQNGKLFIGFLLVWALTALVFNYFTEVNGEEAYYWLFSEHLDWGYLDHPPVLAFFLKPGYWLFHNNLGLRLGILLLNILTMVVIRSTLSVRDDRLLIWIIVGLLPVHLGSLMVKTDVPLLFFTACFFFFYKKYLQDDKLKTVFFLGLSIALMILSKYHGMLVVFFTVFSNVSLFRKRSFYFVAGLSLLFLAPHIYWQYKNDLVSIKFHLYNREDMGFSWSNLFNYLWMQPVFLGPLISVILFAASAFQKTESSFHRALKFTIAGVLIFFFISSFKLAIHKHWTSVLEVPMILLGHEYMTSREGWKKFLKYVSIITVALLLPVRIFLAYDYLPASLSTKIEPLHKWNEWANDITNLSGDLPIMFINQYEQASRYWYLSGKKAHCYNTFFYRESQHDLWPLEDSMQGKSVFVITRYENSPGYKDFTTGNGVKIHYRIIDDFRSFRKVSVEMKPEQITAKSGETVTVTVSLTNRYSYAVDFSDTKGRKVFLNAHFLRGMYSKLDEKADTLTNTLASNGLASEKIFLKMPAEPGKYDLRFSISLEGIEPPINSNKFNVLVEK